MEKNKKPPKCLFTNAGRADHMWFYNIEVIEMLYRIFHGISEGKKTHILLNRFFQIYILPACDLDELSLSIIMAWFCQDIWWLKKVQREVNMLFSMVFKRREHKPMEYELNLAIFCTEDYHMTNLTICIIVIYVSFFFLF